MEFLEWAVIAIAAIFAIYGGRMFLIFIFQKPKEGDKDADLTKKCELFFSIVLVLAGILTYIQRFEIIKCLTHL